MTNFDPAYYANARREIESLLPRQIGSVLEIGCSEGNTLLWLRDSKSIPVCQGIELIPEVAARAKAKGLDVVAANIELDGIPFETQYDLVLCLDVLEHLRDPWSSLRLILGAVKPGGYLITSIPNVNHISVVWDLLLHDSWKYSSTGILDKTHLRFFTRTTARELLADAGLELVQCKSTFARKTHRRLNFLTAGLFKRFFSFQNIFLARKSDSAH